VVHEIPSKPCCAGGLRKRVALGCGQGGAAAQRMRELPNRRRQLHVRLVTDVGEKPQDAVSIGKRQAPCQLALASPKTSAPAGWTAPSRKIVKTEPAGLPKVEKLSKRSRLAFPRSKNCQNEAGWPSQGRKIVKTKPAGLPKVEKLSKPLRECSQREKKSFLAAGWPASPEKKVPTRTGWPASARKKVFQPPAGRPTQEKKFFGHRLASQAKKKSFLVTGCAPSQPKKVQTHSGWPASAEKKVLGRLAGLPAQKRQFLKSGPSSQTAKDSFSSGLQRTSSIYRFIKNEYELQGLDRLRSLNGKKFNTLEPFIQARIEDRKLNCYLLKPSVPFEVVYDIFGRINTGGMALNKQELRHAFYQGPAIVLLKRLAAQPQFSNWLGVRLNTKRMIDQEAVLRCIAFARVDPSIAYRGNLDKFLNEALKQLNSKSSEAQAERDTIEEQFPRTMQLAHDLLGEDAFRLPALQRRGRLNIPVMESIYRALLLRPRSFWQEQPQLSERYRSLLVYDKYREAVRIGTNNTVHIRFPMAQEFLEGTNV
jgi:hypothetical protein